MKTIKQAQQAKQAAIELATIPVKLKNQTLKNIAIAFKENKDRIINENKKDLDYAKKINLKQSLIKRLKVNKTKLNEIISYVNSVAKLEVGKTISATELDKGLELYGPRNQARDRSRDTCHDSL